MAPGPAATSGRALSEAETGLIRHLLAAHPDATPLQAQLPGLRVTSACGCGCPSVSFSQSGSIEVLTHASTTDGRRVASLLVDDKGRLDGLELSWLTDHTPTNWPTLDELEPPVPSEIKPVRRRRGPRR